MFNKIRALFITRCIEKNAFGWRLENNPMAIVIRPPKSKWTFLYPLKIFIINIVLLVICYLMGSNITMAVLIACPFSLLIGMLAHQEAALIVSRTSKALAFGDQTRIPIYEVQFKKVLSAEIVGALYTIQLKTENMLKPAIVWETDDEDEAARVMTRLEFECEAIRVELKKTVPFWKLKL
jgi:hypothetical protein